MKKLILLLLIIKLVSANVIINEFLPNPENQKEFIELYNPTEELINLKDYYFIDKSNHTIKIPEKVIKPSEFIIIETKAFLNNDKEEVKLFQQNNLVDQINYSYSKKGYSYSKINNKWVLTKPTPNEGNKLVEETKSKYNTSNTETNLNPYSNSSEVIYESKQEKSTKYSFYILPIIIILLLFTKWNKK
ncbi:MAG: lamin tail domain-containing protein [Candidatus Nanoarchaeia archaeon]|nr:lamin tail domain-containing protein [Candidatus Nanoarchaeia archaeon]